MHARALVNGKIEEDDEDDEDDEEYAMDTSDYKPRPLRRSYRNQLMLSEWLVEKPNDLEKNWLMMLCPEGKRCFVIAGHGTTKAFAKSGWMIRTFPSWLPGGCRRSGREKCSLLDCIFSETEKKFYVLDAMMWNTFNIYETSTDLRSFFIASKLEETPALSQTSNINPFTFQLCPRFPCNPSVMYEALSTSHFGVPLDGVLFYHKEAQYIPGHTPLVGWLKPYMLPEILDVAVPQNVLMHKPNSIANMTIRTHLDEEVVKYEKVKEGIALKDKKIEEQAMELRERRNSSVSADTKEEENATEMEERAEDTEETTETME